MGTEFDGQFTGQYLFQCFRVEADMGRNDGRYAMGHDEFAYALAGIARRYGDSFDILDAFFQHAVDDLIGCKLAVPVAEHDGLAIVDMFQDILERKYFR